MTVSNSRSQPNIVLTTLVPVVAEKNDIGDIYREHIRKFLPLLRLPEFNLVRAANYLEDWIGDMLPAKPLLDVSAFGAELPRLQFRVCGLFMAKQFSLQIPYQTLSIFSCPVGYTSDLAQVCLVPQSPGGDEMD